MKLVVMRSKNSKVDVDAKTIGSIDSGLVILVGVSIDDTIEDAKYLANKVLNLRIFADEDGIMNKSILDVNGHILSISQFTLLADTRHGNRPSYIKAMKGNEAKNIYDYLNRLLREKTHVETGQFGADMLVNIENDGPVTIILDSKNK